MTQTRVVRSIPQTDVIFPVQLKPRAPIVSYYVFLEENTFHP